MRRRTFCASGLSTLVSASLPYSRVFAAAGDDVARWVWAANSES